MSDFILRPVNGGDREWISRLMVERWGSKIVVVHSTTYTPANLPGMIAVLDDNRIGLITYSIQDDECEIVTLDSLLPSQGIGTRLIDEVKRVAKAAGCYRIWLTTTNDNLKALQFYKSRGFTLCAIHKNAVEKAREIKPEIPLLGQSGIPIRDEIELDMILDI
jgi:ribosomal protein S18 acetylase RimI-like enzyme